MNENRLVDIITRFPAIRIAVLGDFFLDRYWDIDPQRDEPSLETGLTAYQIVGRRESPGAAGTVVNNLAALGIGKIFAVGFVGQDGEGNVLETCLDRLGVDRTFLTSTSERFTPCYTKPMRSDVEMNRFDIKNRTPTPESLQRRLVESLRAVAPMVDAVMVMDQVSEENAGVVTESVRETLAELGRSSSALLLYADSRERIGLFREMIIKCNDRELAEQFGVHGSENVPPIEDLHACGAEMSRRTGRCVFVTLGGRGQLVIDPSPEQGGAESMNSEPTIMHVPAFTVDGPIDIVGAGDATSSGLVGALCAGATPVEAATLGNLAASVTIRKLGCTGTATPDELVSALRAASG